MSTPINLDMTDPRFSTDGWALQPIAVINDAKTVEEGVASILALAQTSQEKLVLFMQTMQSALQKEDHMSTFYNPGVKSTDSAIKK